MFKDWKKNIYNPEILKHLLWEYDLSNFDWQDMKEVVVYRVIERGGMNDYYAMFGLYGGIKGVKQIIKELPQAFSSKDLSFVCKMFNLKKENLKCYIRTQLREKRLNS